MRRYDCLWINPPNWRQIYALDSHSTVPPVAIRKGSRSREYDHRVRERLVRHIARVLETKKLIGQPGKTQNIPDGYLLDFSSAKKPVLYLVEVELAKHDPLRHIAQLLGFSLSFQSTPHLHLKNAATLPPSTVVTSPVVFIANA